MKYLEKAKAKLYAFAYMLAALFTMAPVRANPIYRFSKKFVSNKKAFSAVLVSIVVVVVAAIMIMVTTVILSRVASSISRTGLSEEANNTLDSVESQGYGAMNLLTIVLVVTAAVAIIGAVIGIFAYIKMRE